MTVETPDLIISHCIQLLTFHTVPIKICSYCSLKFIWGPTCDLASSATIYNAASTLGAGLIPGCSASGLTLLMCLGRQQKTAQAHRDNYWEVGVILTGCTMDIFLKKMLPFPSPAATSREAWDRMCCYHRRLQLQIGHCSHDLPCGRR